MKLSSQQQQVVFKVIKQSIQQGLQGIKPQTIRVDDKVLNQPGAAFVTLHLNGALRGCIGSLEAHRPLIEDIAHNAFSAAFRDPRFEPVTAVEAEQLAIEFSVLSPPRNLPYCDSKQELIGHLQPYQDGLILADGFRRATFLPSVWEQVPEPEAFVDHLMRKAGMSEWTPTMQCQRYSVEAYQTTWQQIAD